MTYKEISLTQGKVAMVDAADFEWLSQWKWQAVSPSGHWYAVRNQRDDAGKRRYISMHRFILNAPDGMEVDHIDANGLDNRRQNLRVATVAENRRNRRRARNNRSGFNGVAWAKHERKWRATVRVNGKQIHVGYYHDLIKAAVARDLATIEHYGEFVTLNFPRGLYA
jgi:hypothetical protein